MKIHRPLCALALLAVAPLAAAQAYKCTVDGRTTYQDTPCAGGGGTKLDLPGAWSPPPLAGGRKGEHKPEDLALGLAFDKIMVQRCPLGRASASRLDTLATALVPMLQSVSKAQLEAIDAAATKRASDLLGSANRTMACRYVDGSIEQAWTALTQGGPREAKAKPTL